MSKKGIDAFSILNHHLIAGFKGKHEIYTDSYGLELIPSFVISSETPFYEKDSLYEDPPIIWLYLYNQEKLFQDEYNNTGYYYVAAYRCRDSMYLLEFILRVLNENSNYLIRTVENNLVDVGKLQRMYNEKFYNWMYIEE